MTMSNVIQFPVGKDREWRPAEAILRPMFRDVWGVTPEEMPLLLERVRVHWDQLNYPWSGLEDKYELPPGLGEEHQVALLQVAADVHGRWADGWTEANQRTLQSFAKLEFELIRSWAGKPRPHV
jgi:hypothetical protein